MRAPSSFSLASEVCAEQHQCQSKIYWVTLEREEKWPTYFTGKRYYRVLPLGDKRIDDGTAQLAGASSDGDDGHVGLFFRLMG
jgi:hypothetical protein